MPPPSLREEFALRQAGYKWIAGLDEAGRGAWAGPVVAGAVVLPLDREDLPAALAAVRDSKRLTPQKREFLLPIVEEVALASAVGRAEPAEIDRMGIAPATRLAMTRALHALGRQPDFLLLDAFPLPESPLPQRAIVHGDALCLSIAAASILAKVTRDRWMCELDGDFPGYGLARHKGYGTAAHRRALDRLGPTPLHRMSWAPMRRAPAQRSASPQVA